MGEYITSSVPVDTLMMFLGTSLDQVSVPK